MNINSLPFIRVTIAFKIKEPEKFPKYPFSPFRGVFGAALKRFSCVAKRYNTCIECPLNQYCAYGYLFETPRPKDAKRLRLYPYVPHPFVFALSPLEKASSELKVKLTLIGKAIQYFPHVILALETAGKMGIGKNRVPFCILWIKDLSTEEKLYQSGLLKPPKLYELHSTELKSPLTLKFITPVRLRYEGKIVGPQRFAFHILIRNLLRRISALFYFHAGQELKLDFKNIIAKAEEVEVVDNQLKLLKFKRYSARTKQTIEMGGLIGTVSFKGELNQFSELLRLGECLQVGKNTSFGLGVYQIISIRN